MAARDIIIRPIVTEKSLKNQEEDNSVCFTCNFSIHSRLFKIFKIRKDIKRMKENFKTILTYMPGSMNIKKISLSYTHWMCFLSLTKDLPITKFASVLPFALVYSYWYVFSYFSISWHKGISQRIIY